MLVTVASRVAVAATAALLLAACVSPDSITPASATSSSTSTPATAATPEATASSAAPDSSPSSSDNSAGTTNLPLGKPVNADGDGIDGQHWSMRVQATSTKTSRKGVSEFGEAPKKGRLVGVLVQYQCEQGACNYNTFDWTLRADDGTTYDQAFGGFEPALQSGTLHSGVKAKGYVTWDAPPGHYSVEYQTSGLSQDVASWAITVK